MPPRRCYGPSSSLCKLLTYASHCLLLLGVLHGGIPRANGREASSRTWHPWGVGRSGWDVYGLRACSSWRAPAGGSCSLAHPYSSWGSIKRRQTGFLIAKAVLRPHVAVSRFGQCSFQVSCSYGHGGIMCPVCLALWMAATDAWERLLSVAKKKHRQIVVGPPGSRHYPNRHLNASLLISRQVAQLVAGPDSSTTYCSSKLLTRPACHVHSSAPSRQHGLDGSDACPRGSRGGDPGQPVCLGRQPAPGSRVRGRQPQRHQHQGTVSE